MLRKLEVVDSHMHLTDRFGAPYFSEQYQADILPAGNIAASVYVESGMGYRPNGPDALKVVGETEFAVRHAERGSTKQHALASAILASMDFALGSNVERVLNAHIDAGQGRFRGIRSSLAWDADSQAGYGELFPWLENTQKLLGEQPYIEAARCMMKLGLVLDIWVFHPQLPRVAIVAAQCPDLAIVIDHIGGPLGVGGYSRCPAETRACWAANLRQLAAYPNVYIKLSGMGISRMGFHYQSERHARTSCEIARAWRDHAMACIDIFTPQRVIFGSNFPVDRAVADYEVVLEAYVKMTETFSDQDREAIFGANARTVYKLNERG